MPEHTDLEVEQFRTDREFSRDIKVIVMHIKEYLDISLEEFGGKRLVTRMTDLVKETWPGASRIESIRLRGSAGGGDIRVTFTEGERTRTALIDALSHRILDVMDG